MFDGLTSVFSWVGMPMTTSERIDGSSPKIRLGVRRKPPKALILTS